MREVCPEHDLGDALAGRKKVLPEYSFVKYGIARIIKTWAKNKITNVPVLTETILRNEKAKYYTSIQTYSIIQSFLWNKMIQKWALGLIFNQPEFYFQLYLMPWELKKLNVTSRQVAATIFLVPISFKILWLINNLTSQFAFPLLCLHSKKKKKISSFLNNTLVLKAENSNLHYLETSTALMLPERKQGRPLMLLFMQ